MIIFSPGEYSNALSTLSVMVSEVEERVERPYCTLLKECEESQFLLLLLLKVKYHTHTCTCVHVFLA